MQSTKQINLVPTSKAAETLGVSTSTLYRMIDKGLLVPVKTPGGQRRFSTIELEKYLEKSKDIVAPQNPRENKHSEIEEKDEISEQIKNTEHPTKGTVDARNKLNELTGKEWLLETKSYFFQKGLGASHPHAQIEKQHPAPYSYQDIAHLVTFFTKQGQHVLDPFGGVGSTAKACAINNRFCTQIELSQTWHDLAIKRLEDEVGKGESDKHTFINKDCRQALRDLDNDSFDFMVTSPPYWAILNKRADHKVKATRIDNSLATNYSNDAADLGNVEKYSEFIDILVDDVFVPCAEKIKPNKYMCIVVSDFRHKSEFISFHSDLIQKLNQMEIGEHTKLSLQGIKALLQNHKSLLPYGYPFAYVENIHHQYILIFRKEAKG